MKKDFFGRSKKANVPIISSECLKMPKPCVKEVVVPSKLTPAWSEYVPPAPPIQNEWRPAPKPKLKLRVLLPEKPKPEPPPAEPVKVEQQEEIYDPNSKAGKLKIFLARLKK